MKQISAVLFVEAQVADVQQIHHVSALEPHSCQPEERRSSLASRDHINGDGFLLFLFFFLPAKLPKNCKLDVWIVIFFSPENQ